MVRIVQCVFWLMVVYAAILTHGTFRLSELTWDGGAVAGQAAKAGSADAASTDLVGTLAAGTAFCARHADECLADARQLSALFAAADPQPQIAASDDDAMPARDSRHKKRDAKPARAP